MTQLGRQHRIEEGQRVDDVVVEIELRVRHRDGSEELLSIKDASVRLDFYNLDTAQEPDDALENWLGKGVESPVGVTQAQMTCREWLGSRSMPDRRRKDGSTPRLA